MWSRVPTGAVGTRGDKKLRDGGVTTQPEFGGWDPLGKTWVIEGHGIDPDVTLGPGPEGFLGGHDPQLDYAIKDLLDKIARDPRDLASCRPSKGQLGCGPY